MLKTFFVTADRFPCAQRRTVVLQSASVELNPVENAIADLCAKNARLRVCAVAVVLGNTCDAMPPVNLL